eukprot:198761-Amphidinium_carterae.1
MRIGSSRSVLDKGKNSAWVPSKTLGGVTLDNAAQFGLHHSYMGGGNLQDLSTNLWTRPFVCAWRLELSEELQKRSGGRSSSSWLQQS